MDVTILYQCLLLRAGNQWILLLTEITWRENFKYRVKIKLEILCQVCLRKINKHHYYMKWSMDYRRMKSIQNIANDNNYFQSINIPCKKILLCILHLYLHL